MKQRMGPWFVLQPGKAVAGMSFAQLQSLVHQKQVTSRSVVRGPSTGHLWRLASKVRGISREFGLCYACGGDIETTEMICPHCDRSQNIPDQPATAQKQQAAAPRETSEAPAPRERPKHAEPAIHVHTLSEGTGKEEFECLLRPVIAEQYERHIPKDDLLTPRDVAKAFQLEFGMNSEQADRFFDKAIVRKIKVAAISATSLAVAIAIIWPMIHVIPAWLPLPAATASATPAPETTTPPTAVASTFSSVIADARPAGDQIAAYHSDPVASPAVHPKPSEDPIIVADPTPSSSPADDPSILWNTGLDAESAGNYTKAVEAYERIESLPSYLWPTHLETRLALARKELKGEVK
jgi:hypothetical protein